jgi:hypothetical protein
MGACRDEERVMTLKIAQSAAPNLRARWDWSVWIEGTDNELDGIEEVTWKLHPTFPTPIRHVQSRETKFKLSTSGWGEFEIFATLNMKNGRSRSLQHWLRLVDPVESGRAATVKSKTAPQGSEVQRPAVFLSYGLNNASLAAHLANELKSDYEVVRDIDIPEGADLRLWNREQIGKSDAVIVLGADESGVSRSPEVKIAQSKGVPVIPVTIGSRSNKISPTLGKIKPLRVTMDSPIKVAPTLATMIGKLLKT